MLFLPKCKARGAAAFAGQSSGTLEKAAEMQMDQRVVRPNSFGFDLNLEDYENNFDFDDRQITWEDLGL